MVHKMTSAASETRLTVSHADRSDSFGEFPTNSASIQVPATR